MGEDSFFNGLFHVMWNMETDIFSEKEKTLALLADIVPKCKKQRKRLEAMYNCDAMDFIEKAVADRDSYEINMKRAVRLLVNEMNLSSERALFAVNQIAALWDGDLDMLEEYDEDENLDDDDEEEELEDSEEDADDEDYIEEDGDEDMIFLQNVAAEENAEAQNEQEAEVQEEGGGEEQPSEPRESVVKKIIHFWCEGDFEDGRPYMFACPIGWVLIILCSVLGAFMIYDIPLGDKFAAPTFAFMFAVLTSKRLYRFESTGRFSLLIGAFYIASMGRVLWLGKGEPPIACVPIVLAALIVFNSGRIGSWLDEAKKNSFLAYFIITVFSAAVTVGVYAIQHVEF